MTSFRRCAWMYQPLFFLLCLQSHHTYSMSMTKSRDIRYHMYDEYVIYVSMYDEYNLKYINRSKKHIFYVHKSFQTFYMEVRF